MHLEQECDGLAQSRHFIHLPAADTLLPDTLLPGGWKWVSITRLGVAGTPLPRAGNVALLH
jgi:hypothetical protein